MTGSGAPASAAGGRQWQGEPRDAYSSLGLRLGTKYGGWFGLGSFVAAYPETPAIYLEQAWELDADGTFVRKVEETTGMYVPCADVVTVELLMGSETDAVAGAGEEAKLVDTMTGSTDTEREEVP